MAYTVKRNRLRWLIAGLILPPPDPPPELPQSLYVGTETHYVSSTADGTGDGLTRQTAWSVDQYRNNAQPGNRVMFLQGTYDIPGVDDKWGSPLNPSATGTPSQPIIVFCEYRGSLLPTNSPNRVVIRINGSFASGGITIRGKQDVHFEGFCSSEADYTSPQVPDGMVVGIHESTDCSISYCRVQVISHAGGSGFNHAALRLERTLRCRFFDNYVNGEIGGNTSCILVYGSKDYEIEHNRCIGGTNGIFLKGDNTPGSGQYLIENPAQVHHNFVSSIENGIYIGGPKPASGQTEYLRIYCNIIRDATTCALRLVGFDGISPSHIQIANNNFEVVATAAAIVFMQTTADLNTVLLPGPALINSLSKNNIFMVTALSSVTRFIQCESEYNLEMLERIEWNDNSSFNTRVDNQYIELSKDSTQLTPSDWDARGHGVTTTDDPLFIDRINEDYRLQSGSPCLNNATDELDILGNGAAYIVNRGAQIDNSQTIGVRP